MNILLVITKAEIGGAQVFILNLAKELKKKGHNVEVAAGLGKYLTEELNSLNIKYHFLNSLKRNINLVNTISFIHELYTLSKKNEYDIIHLNSSNTLVGSVIKLNKSINSKFVFTFHGLSFLDKNFESSFLIKTMSKQYFKFFNRFVDKSVFVCQNNLDFCLKKNIVKEGTVVLNGLDAETVSHLSKEEANSYFLNNYNIIFQKNFVIGSSGRLAYPKNYEFLIENFSRIKSVIPNVKLLIAGDGPDREKLQKRISELDLKENIFLVGSIKNFYTYIKVFDVFILPSIFEGLSISLIEAVFAGIPILTSDVGGNSEILNNDKNQLFELNNSEEFLSKLLLIKENAESISRRNLKLSNNFRQDIMAEKYLKIYHACNINDIS